MIKDITGFIKKTRKCKTPGAYYGFKINSWNNSIEMSVGLPFHIKNLSKTHAKELENRLHNAFEEILAPFFDKNLIEETYNDSGTRIEYLNIPNKWEFPKI